MGDLISEWVGCFIKDYWLIIEEQPYYSSNIYIELIGLTLIIEYHFLINFVHSENISKHVLNESKDNIDIVEAKEFKFIHRPDVDVL